MKFLGDQMPDEVHRIANRLRFRQIRLIFLRLRRPRVSAYASVYIPDPALCVSRLYEPKNRSAAMAPADETSLARIANLDVVGRAGLFFYSHLHDQLRFGKDYVEDLLRSGGRTEDEPDLAAYPAAAVDGGS